jgi:hypothetical protein
MQRVQGLGQAAAEPGTREHHLGDERDVQRADRREARSDQPGRCHRGKDDLHDRGRSGEPQHPGDVVQPARHGLDSAGRVEHHRPHRHVAGEQQLGPDPGTGCECDDRQ